MSRDIKYIGMDVHKEATVIAVLNGSGKLVMESIFETKASSILQFIHGLRGELHVTWEEGTWAAWLYDLLQPQVAQVLVCDPRRNALLKEGNKSDKIDARKLADLLRTGMLRPVYHGEHGLRTLRELGQLSDPQPRPEPGDESDQSSISRLEHPLCRYPSVCSALSGRVATEDRACRRAPACRATVSTVGWIAGIATNPAP